MIKAVVFDKDGTLLKFKPLWESATQRVIPAFLDKYGIKSTKKRTDELLEELGVYDEKIDPEKALAWMTYAQMGEVLLKALGRENILIDDVQDVGDTLQKLYYNEITLPTARILPTADLGALFEWLNQKHIIIGMVTADSKRAAVHCLEKLKIDKYFSYIGVAGKRHNPKPAPDLFIEFQKKYHLLPSEILVVGDTPTDMIFAKNSGAVAVGVLSGLGTREDILKNADFIFDDVSQLVDNWEKISAKSLRTCEDTSCREWRESNG